MTISTFTAVILLFYIESFHLKGLLLLQSILMCFKHFNIFTLFSHKPSGLEIL